MSSSPPYKEEKADHAHIFNYEVVQLRLYGSLAGNVQKKLMTLLPQALNPKASSRPTLAQLLSIFGSKKDSRPLLGYFGYTFSVLVFLVVSQMYGFLFVHEPAPVQSHKEESSVGKSHSSTKTKVRKARKAQKKVASQPVREPENEPENEPEMEPDVHLYSPVVHSRIQDTKELEEKLFLRFRYQTLEIHGHKPKDDDVVFFGSFYDQETFRSTFHQHVQKSSFQLQGIFDVHIDIHKNIPKKKKIF